MKITKLLAMAAALMMALPLSACSGGSEGSVSAGQTTMAPPTAGAAVDTAATAQPASEFYLYGEQHGVKKILDRELELWENAYNNDGMRHLFIEASYYAAGFFNVWMQADSDEILDTIYVDWEGTAMHNPDVKEFYKSIKARCPETVFHGTDVGHQPDTTGARFLRHLEDNGMQDSEEYRLTQEAIEQGKYYYDNSDDIFRENKMAENFIREFDGLSGESVLGFYGSAHTAIYDMEFKAGSVPSMASQLQKRYGDAAHFKDISKLVKDVDPQRVDTISINGKDYEASYFGKEDITGISDFSAREFWRLENAYADFADKPKLGDVLPYDNYPMLIVQGQVFVIDYTKTDGSVMRHYYRSDGKTWEGRPTTEEFGTE